MPQGYVRYPHIHQDRIVFVSEDDLWLVSSEGGRAERLTAGVDEISHPRFSPNGQEILYASNAGQFSHRYEVIYAISPAGGQPRQLPFGMANAISYGPDGGIVLGRNVREGAYWKRYRGGTIGHLWCDLKNNGTFRRLLQLDGNVAAPCWVGERIYFLSDHEGVGNIYSCTPFGEDVRHHTEHQDFYARNLSSDGRRLVYHAGAKLYLFDPNTESVQHTDVELPSLRTQLNRKF